MTQPEDHSAALAAQGVRRPSRRNLLLGSGSLIVGGIAGRATAAQAAPQPAAAPPLPWPWTHLDPMEAGTRAYKTYLTSKG